MGLKETVKQLWIKKIEKEYNKLLSAKKVSYDVWVRKQEAEERADGAGSSNLQAAESASRKLHVETADEYVLFLQKNGSLSEHAHEWIAGYFAEHPQVQILYGDEDLLTDTGKREKPWYKPCWSPDTYLSQFYVGSVIAVRKGLVDAVNVADIVDGAANAVNVRADDRIRFNLPEEVRPVLTECIRVSGGFEKGCTSIARCPRVLFHVNDEKVWKNYLESKEPVQERYEGGNDISVIIPSKDNPDVLAKCLLSLEEIAGLEIIIVDNGSSAENKKRIQAFLDEMKGRGMHSIKYLYHPMDFNFSRMCNMGAEAAAGKYLLFLNDDIEACGTAWIYAMKEKAAQSYVGAAGLKLYYPEGIRIQHGGITNLPVGPVHKMQFAEDNKSIYFDRNRADMNCLAVTGACLMIDRSKYAEVGGFKESLRVAYNDVDLGFALYEAGYQNVVINSCYGYHHESLSRGSDESKDKLARLQRERAHLYELHPALKNEDPYYPSGLSKDGLDSRIVPGYINALNTVQEAVSMKFSLDMAQIRVDNCLFLGIEQSEQAGIKGYGVVLGDNNACYDRYVILAEPDKSSDGAAPEPVPMLMVKAESQYRQDLEENMQDQTNVAMCGFHIHFSGEECVKLVKGAEYPIGVMAVHKINKGKLLNWSGRYFTI